MKAFSLEAPPITIGNHSYIPMYLADSPTLFVRDILMMLNSFEKEHPELEVTSWSIEKRDVVTTGKTWHYADGLWVNHRPRTK